MLRSLEVRGSYQILEVERQKWELEIGTHMR